MNTLIACFDLLWYLCYAIFLFAAIRLYKQHPSRARKFLTWGFGILTIVNAISYAEYLNLLTISYNVMAEFYDDYGITGPEWAPWERWYFWAKFLLSNGGFVMVIFGFLGEARYQLNQLKHDTTSLDPTS